MITLTSSHTHYRSFLEREKLAAIMWTTNSVATFGVFVVAETVFYATMPFVMKISNAAVINLSLLSADIYVFIFGVFFFNYGVSSDNLQ